MHEDGIPQYPPDVTDSEDTYPIKYYSEIQARNAKFRYEFAKWCTEPPDHVTMPDNEMVTGVSSGQLAQLTSNEIAYNLILDEPALVRACRIIERAWIAYTILHYDYSYSDDER